MLTIRLPWPTTAALYLGISTSQFCLPRTQFHTVIKGNTSNEYGVPVHCSNLDSVTNVKTVDIVLYVTETQFT